MENREPCLECGGPVDELVYAVYWGKDDPKKGIQQDDIAGFLCDRCREKKKVKSMKNRNELHKLAALKNLL
ncbi:hypothetical protein [Ammoniphilus sp. YIM 78166]|uniref:hypothetical protein n=1 Tax=Ammoniphilus sp. YIM 78166 TaxID=1644106 RepID=UPI00106F38E7|nr:hypothetical protein [Ammoniphilus sp. YIM 78166]